MHFLWVFYKRFLLIGIGFLYKMVCFCNDVIGITSLKGGLGMRALEADGLL
jgi:hypothetical protein